MSIIGKVLDKIIPAWHGHYEAPKAPKVTPKAKALQTFKAPNMKGFKYGVGVGK